jgi:uncharacterized membrane protein YhhN
MYPAIFAAKYFNVDSAERILVPLFVILVFAVSAYLNPIAVGKNKYLFLAFLFICIGDILLNLTNLRVLVAVSFLLTHLNLTLFYSYRMRWQSGDFRLLFPVLLTSAAAFWFVSLKEPSLQQCLLLGCYLLMLTAMLWRALCVFATGERAKGKFLLAGGSFLFYLTDIFVSANVVYETNSLVALTWICYPPALFMLSLMNFPFQSEARR